MARNHGNLFARDYTEFLFVVNYEESSLAIATTFHPHQPESTFIYQILFSFESKYFSKNSNEGVMRAALGEKVFETIIW